MIAYLILPVSGGWDSSHLSQITGIVNDMNPQSSPLVGSCRMVDHKFPDFLKSCIISPVKPEVFGQPARCGAADVEVSRGHRSHLGGREVL